MQWLVLEGSGDLGLLSGFLRWGTWERKNVKAMLASQWPSYKRTQSLLDNRCFPWWRILMVRRMPPMPQIQVLYRRWLLFGDFGVLSLLLEKVSAKKRFGEGIRLTPDGLTWWVRESWMASEHPCVLQGRWSTPLLKFMSFRTCVFWSTCSVA